MKIKMLSALLAAAIWSSTAVAAPAQAPIVIKFSHSSQTNTAKGQAAEMFKKLAEQVTKGRVKVEIYPNLQLYQDKDEIAALQRGDVQMLAPALARFTPLGVVEFEVFDLPFLFPSNAALHRVTDGKIGKDLFKKLEGKGITGLAYWDNGFKNMSANKPLLAPADFKGLKMRIQKSEVIAAQMRALGAEPKMYALAEAYDAIRTGQVDGTENPLSLMYQWKMNTVQRNLTISNHGYLGYAVIVNSKFWDGLPADIRTSLTKVMEEVTDYERVAAKFENDQALAAMRGTGKTEVYVLSSTEEATWRRTLAPVQKTMEARIGKGLIDAANAEVAR